MKYTDNARSTSLLPLLLTFILLLPASNTIIAQSFEEPFRVVPPGILTTVERFKDVESVNLQGISMLTQDRQGFIWLVTGKGLARFDGYEVKLYSEDLADTMGKYRTSFRSIAVDGQGFVWAGTSGAGLKRLDPATGLSRWYVGHMGDSTDLRYGSVLAMLGTVDGELWAGVWYGLAKYSPESDSLTRFPVPPEYGATGNRITSLCDIGRSIWIALWGIGVAEFNRDNHGWKLFKHDGASGSGLSTDTVLAVCGDHTGILWIGTQAGLDRYDPVANSWQHPGTAMSDSLRIPRVPVPAVVEDMFGDLWIAAAGQGLFRLDPANGKVVQYLHNPADPNSIIFDAITKLYTPRLNEPARAASPIPRPTNSIVWIPYGTPEMNKVTVRKNPCSSVIFRMAKGLPGAGVPALLHEAGGIIWAGEYSGGIGAFDLKKGTCRWYLRTPADLIPVGIQSRAFFEWDVFTMGRS